MGEKKLKEKPELREINQLSPRANSYSSGCGGSCGGSCGSCGSCGCGYGKPSSDYKKIDLRASGDEKRKNMNGSLISIVPDSAEYMRHAPERARIENMLLPLAMYKIDGFSYFQRELAHASHPTMKRMAEVIETGGSGISSRVIWGVLSYNLKDISAAFKSDRDAQMFVTLYFWKYLCHFANIDFSTGKDRTRMLLEE